jgi:hypothetical protein
VTNKMGFGFDDRVYWTVMQLVPGLENRDYGRGDPLR